MTRKLICPICKEKTDWEGNPFRPFCSERCKLIDLASWIGGEYRIPDELPDRSGSDKCEEVKGGEEGKQVEGDRGPDYNGRRVSME